MIEKRFVDRGMDLDSADEVIANGKTRRLLNMHSGTSTSGNGKVERAKGNILVSNILPAGTNKTIGSYLDETENQLYYFNYNDLGQHGIYRWLLDSTTVTTVLVDPLLNFDPDYLITGVDIAYIDPDVPLIGWTDGGATNAISPTVLRNPPRQLDINKAIDYSQGDLVNGYPAITVEILDQVKYPPEFSPDVQFVDDQTYEKNNFRGKLTQYKYRYVYKDYSKSAWSPISQVVNPVHAQIIGNVTYLPFFFDNRIDITILQGGSECEFVELAVSIQNGTNTDFYLFDTIDNPTTSSLVYSFYNDKLLLPLDVTESNKLYDDVPRVAQAQTIGSNNRRYWGNVVNQFDLPTPDVSLVNIQQALDAPQALVGSFSSVDGLYLPNPTPPPSAVFVQVITLPTPYPYAIGTVIQSITDSNIAYVVSAADINSVTVFRDNFVDYLNTVFPYNGWTAAIGTGYLGNGLSPSIPLAPNQLVVTGFSTGNPSIPPQLSFNIYSFESGYSNWLSGFNKTFGLVYYDRANRSTSAITDNNFNIQVPSVQGGLTQYLKRNFIGWNINHTPPIYATHYQWVARYTAPLSFIDFAIRGATNSGTQTLIDLTPIIDYSTQNPSSILSYAFTQGDRCQFLTLLVNIPFSNFIDVAVNGFDESTNILSVDQVDISALNITTGALIRVYTPQPDFSDDQAVFYEFSQQFEIGDAGLATRYHKGQTQDQTSTLPATGIFDRGDVWIRPRRMATTNNATFQNYWVEDANFSDFYNSKVWDKGRPNAFDKNFRETNRPTTIYYSQPFIPETNINGLGSVFLENFGSDDIKISLSYKSIQKLYEQQGNLYCFQELATCIVPISNQTTIDIQGGQIAGATDRVLNQVNRYYQGYGINKNPESFIYFAGRFYHSDALHGVWLRLSADGYTPISQLRGQGGEIAAINNYTQERFNEISNLNQKVNIFGAYDVRYDSAVWGVEDTDGRERSFEGFTVSFYEAGNMWESFWSFKPDWISRNAQELITFKDGELYVHDKNPLYSNYYGVQYPAEISIPSNESPSETKVYQAVSMESNKAVDITEITTQGQLTNLITTDFLNFEKKYYSNLYRDTLTPNVANPFINGDAMRGTTMLAKLQDNTTTEFVLYAFNYNFAGSPPNGI
jgi:hypothetical protein